MPTDQEIEAEIDRIMNMTDDEVMAEHLAQYDGDEKLAQKAIDLMVARAQALLAKYRRQ